MIEFRTWRALCSHPFANRKPVSNLCVQTTAKGVSASVVSVAKYPLPTPEPEDASPRSDGEDSAFAAESLLPPPAYDELVPEADAAAAAAAIAAHSAAGGDGYASSTCSAAAAEAKQEEEDIVSGVAPVASLGGAVGVPQMSEKNKESGVPALTLLPASAPSEAGAAEVGQDPVAVASVLSGGEPAGPADVVAVADATEYQTLGVSRADEAAAMVGIDAAETQVEVSAGFGYFVFGWLGVGWRQPFRRQASVPQMFSLVFLC